MCAIFGFLNYSKTSDSVIKGKIIRKLSIISQIRGIDAAGYAYVNNDNLIINKRSGPAYKFDFKFPNESVCVMGHCRAASQGRKNDNHNNHPFYGCSNVKFALAHNGIIYNDLWLRKERNLPQIDIRTDSYIAVQLLEKHFEIGFDSLREMAESICGSFMITVLTENNVLYLVRGNKPVYIIHIPSLKMYIYSSTKFIMMSAIWKLILHSTQYQHIKMEKGDILRIDSNGQIQREKFRYSFSTVKNLTHMIHKIGGSI